MEKPLSWDIKIKTLYVEWIHDSGAGKFLEDISL